MYLTNTTFQHKAAHRTTWTAPDRLQVHMGHDGKPRRNPYRNQIDYIITKTEHQRFVENSRSYGGTETSTDHKLVKATIRFAWWKMKTSKLPTQNIDINNFAH
jgi:hypothetical protein